MDPVWGFSFFLFAFVAAVTPGPSNVIVLATGAALGPWKGLTCPIGVSLGMGAVIFLSTLGIGELVATVPSLVIAMKLAGSAFLSWLAVKMALSGPLKAGPLKDGSRPNAVGFSGAFLFQWFNPKAWLVALAAGGTYVSPEHQGQIEPAFLMAVLFACAAFPAGLIWLSAGSIIARGLTAPKAARTFNIAMAVLLAASLALVWR